jgi:tetratricopeptide (TPR) repeat protein
LEIETSIGTDHALVVVDEVLPVLERHGDDHGQCRAWSLRAQAAWNVGQVERADAAWAQAADWARRAGDERELFAIIGWRATAAVFGRTPVGEAIARCEQFRDRVSASPVAVAWAVNALAYLHAMRGELDLAEGLLQQANETLHQLGSLHSTVSHIEALIRLLADQPALAEIALRADVDALAPMGAGGLLATTTALLAQAVFAQGRVTEAGELCQDAADAAPTDDIFTQVIWRGVKAKVLAAEGRCEHAEALAREAVALVQPTDYRSLHGDAMLDLAEVLHGCSRRDAYQDAVQAALSLYENKGNAIGAARARALLRSKGGEE